MTEKIGKDEGTQLDEDFKEMEKVTRSVCYCALYSANKNKIVYMEGRGGEGGDAPTPDRDLSHDSK